MRTNSMAQPEWKDSYPRLLSIKIDSHDDDVAHKLEPGRELEGGAEVWRRRYSLERSTLGETCHGEIGEPIVYSTLHARLSPVHGRPRILIVFYALFPSIRRISIRGHHFRIYVVCVITIGSSRLRLSARVHPGLIGRLGVGPNRTLPQLGS